MAEVKGIIVDLKIEPDTVLLFLMLGADGSITRRGTGTLESTDGNLYIGMTDPAIFRTVRSHLTGPMLQRLGRSYRQQDVRGAPCKLTILFQFNDNSSNGCAFLFGSESHGPPGEVVAFATAAVRETERWYQEQLRLTSRGQ